MDICEVRVIFSYYLAQLLRASNPFHLAAVFYLPKPQKRENLQEMVSRGKTTLKAIGKMTPESPTCAIDADQLIMRDRINLEGAGEAGGEKDKMVDFSTLTPGHADDLLFAKVTPSSLMAAPPPPPSPPPQPPTAVTLTAPYSKPAPVPSRRTDLNDNNFLLLVQLDRPGRAAEENETGKVAKKRMEAKRAPAVPEPAPAAFAAAPVVQSAPASASAIAAALSPPLADSAPALGDSNFLLLAEFAHVVRDTLALRGIQVQDFCSTLKKITGPFFPGCCSGR